MSLRARYSAGLFGVFSIFALAYLILTIRKVDSTQDSTAAEPSNALSNDAKSLGGRHERNLYEPETSALRAQLKIFAPQKFWIIAETGIFAPESEQMRFADQLRSLLLSAGWIESRLILQRMGSAGFKESKMASYSRGGDSGIVIYADNASIPAGKRLNIALNRLLIKSSLEVDDNIKNAILIFVGDQ
jgi:hypothetical protein